MNDDNRIYTIVYCSKSRVGSDSSSARLELQNILAAARRNNAALNVTGALLYNAGNFAQILEGPLASVEQIFESIQRDFRHSEVTVIHSDFSTARQFADWSMAFSGASSIEEDIACTAAFEYVFSGTSSAGEEMLSLLHNLMLDESDWPLLDTAATRQSVVS